MKRQLLIITFMVLSCSVTYAQQDAVYSQFLENPVIVNPAFVGFEKGINVELRSRVVQKNLQGATYLNGSYGDAIVFSTHTPLNYGRMGIGLQVFKQSVKQWITTQYMLQYSYRINFWNGQLGLGIEGGVRNYKSEWGSSNPEDEDDPLLTEQGQYTPDLGAGIYYQDDRFQFGLSGKQLLSLKISEDYQARQFRAWHVIASYSFDVTEDYQIQPAIYLKYSGTVFQGDLITKLTYKETAWVGGGIRTENQFLVFAGVHLHQFFNFYQKATIGYSYDSGRSAMFSTGTHSQELFLHLNLSGRPSKKKLEHRKLVASPMHF